MGTRRPRPPAVIRRLIAIAAGTILGWLAHRTWDLYRADPDPQEDDDAVR